MELSPTAKPTPSMEDFSARKREEIIRLQNFPMIFIN